MRNFANKIWNASRYVLMNLTIDQAGLPDLGKLEIEDKWVLSRLNTLIREVTENLDSYELGVASAKVYDFIWDTYCDWYIELTHRPGSTARMRPARPWPSRCWSMCWTRFSACSIPLCPLSPRRSGRPFPTRAIS